MIRYNSILFFSFIVLAIEFLDELVFGAREAAWPLIRSELGLTYTQIGLLLGILAVIGNLITTWATRRYLGSASACRRWWIYLCHQTLTDCYRTLFYRSFARQPYFTPHQEPLLAFHKLP